MFMEYNALLRKLPIGIQAFEKLRKGTICMWIRPNSFGKWLSRLILIS